MKKHFIPVLLTLAVNLSCSNISFSQEIQNTDILSNEKIVPSGISNISAQVSSPSAIEKSTVVPASTNTNLPNLVAPIVKMPNNEQKNSVKPKKVDLRAIIFDPNAQIDAEAKAEGREMTKAEEFEYNLNNALHGSVTSVNDIPRKGLSADKTTIKFKSGPLESITPSFSFKGSTQNIWLNENYQNTLYNIDTMYPMIEGKFKDKKTSFRSMFLVGPTKEGHTFFNDFIGDQYIMYSWRPEDQILAGYSRNAVGIEGGLSPLALPLYTRSQIARTYNNVRALGAKAQGQHKLYDYNIGFFSSGRYFMDWFPGPEFVGSFAIKPLGLTNGKYGRLLMGGGLDAGNAEGKFTVGSAFAEYEYKRLDIMCEYASADGSNGSTGYNPNQSEGMSGTVSYRITPKLQALVRYDQFDPNKTKKNDIRREYTAGLNYYLKGQALRLIVNYVLYSIENGTYGSKIIVGTQIIL